jgi:hypothetical protein
VIVLSVMPAVISILRARHQLKVLNQRRSAPVSRVEGE